MEFKISDDLRVIEFNEQPIAIKISEKVTRKFVLREMSADRVIEWEQESTEIIKSIIEGEMRPLLESEETEDYIKTSERIKEMSADLLSRLLIPVDGEGPATPGMIRKYMSYRHRTKLMDVQAELNGQGEIKEVSFLLLKSLAYEIARSRDGKITRQSKPLDPGYLPSLDLADTLEANAL